jgi:hypothetical protein
LSFNQNHFIETPSHNQQALAGGIV